MTAFERSHKKLDAWKQAMDLVGAVYRVSSHFPADERFGLAMQLRRAAVSIPSNIAEGSARQSVKEHIHFVVIARGSLSEVETQLLIAQQLGYCEDSDPIFSKLESVSRLLQGLLRYLESVKNGHQ